MPIIHPYKRTYRRFVNGYFIDRGQSDYVLHADFAQEPEHYIRAFLLLLKDLQEIFDYIEPADDNLDCYSFRIHALLLRACVEIEANCKAILKENGYPIKKNKKGEDIYWDMKDYRKNNTTHRRSSYQVKLPFWNGTKKEIWRPFLSWSIDNSLPWFQAYNETKHDRQAGFKEAKFEHLLDACCGVFVILSAQFGTNDFLHREPLFLYQGRQSRMSYGIGEYLKVRFPDDWPLELCYSFEWSHLKLESNPIDSIDYTLIS